VLLVECNVEPNSPASLDFVGIGVCNTVGRAGGQCGGAGVEGK